MVTLKLDDKVLIKESREALQAFYTQHRREYIDLFFHETDLEYKKFPFANLISVGILKRIGDKIRANVQVFPLSGRFICTDFLISLHKMKKNRCLRERDDVWAILPYESPFLAKKACVREGNVVLDLATGSGIVAIFCAEKARKVIATDINPKAITYARFNAILNNVEDKIEFRAGDLFAPVKGLTFDLIIWNGPTLAVPNNPKKYPVYCFGGPDGLDFTRKFITQAPQFLTEKGKMQWLDPSLGGLDTPETLQLVKEHWGELPFRVTYEQRTPPSDLFKTIAYLDKRLIEHPIRQRPQTPLWIEPLTSAEYRDWLKFLKTRHFTHIHAGMFTVYKGKRFQLIKTFPDKAFYKRMNQLPAEYHFLSHDRIKQHLQICESY